MGKIEIVLICDEAYVIPTSVAIFSMYKSKQPDSHYRIHVIANIENTRKIKFLEKMSCANFEVNVILTNGTSISGLHTGNGESYCVASESALLKFFIPQLVNAEKVLYLDGDILVMNDLGHLYATELKEAYAAVVIDSGKLYSNRAIMKCTDNYFNSGVMLLNTNKMQSITEKLITAKRNQTDKSLMDQDVFNEVISHNVINLPIKYNFLYTNLMRAREKFSMDSLNKLYDTQYNNLREIFLEACIIHYSSKDKPWICTEAPMARKWYECYQMMRNSFIDDNDMSVVFEEFESNLPDDIRMRNAIECGNKKLIVSFTSFPARINVVGKVVDSIFAQTEIPDRVILWLTEEEFPGKEADLPEELLEKKKSGLEILWGEWNLKPHKKYFFVMQQNPEDIIITIDDDIVYDTCTIASLYKSYLKFPHAVSAMRMHAIACNSEGEIQPYMNWEQDLEHNLYQPSLNPLATGCGGVLYPPHCMHAELFNREEAMRLCPTTDDLWLKIMQVKVGTPVVLAYPNMPLNIIKESQTTALYRQNRAGGNNDRHFRAIMEYYEDSLEQGSLHDVFKQSYEILQKELNRPIISVVLSVCNKNAGIRECIESILKQTLKSIEIIIIDNGSKGTIAAEYARKNKNITVVTRKEYTVATASNKGLQEACGKYIVFADPDTIYEQDWLKELYMKISQNDADIAICKIDYLDKETKQYRASDWDRKFYKLPATCTYKFSDMKEDRFNTLSYIVEDKLYKREFLIKNQMTFSTEGACYGDMKFIYMGYHKAEKIVHVDKVLGHSQVESVYKFNNSLWENIKASILNLKNKLIEEEIYEKWKKDYYNFVVSVSLREYRMLNNSARVEERYNSLREYEFQMLGVDKLQENDFYDVSVYRKYLYIMTFEYSWPLIRETNRVDKAKLESMEAKVANLLEINEILSYSDYSLKEVRKSWSYRIGLFITFIPRKLCRRKS